MFAAAMPLGSGSLTVAPVAVDGPALLTTTVYVRTLPTWKVVTPSVFVMLRSAAGVMVVGSLAASLVVLVWPPPLTAAVLVTVAAAVELTLTVTVMTG